MQAPTPVNEAERLLALERYGVIDTAPEAGFDDLTALAATLCACPIALIGLVDASREVFKSRYGTGIQALPREISPGAHAMLQGEIWVVADAGLDPRLDGRRLTAAGLPLRFYAAVPLLDPQRNPLGVLCVIDHRPRQLTAAQGESLVRLGSQVVAQLELRCARDRARAALRAVTEKHAALETVHEELRALSYIISHDLRAPLINLLGFTGELRRLMGMVKTGVSTVPAGTLGPDVLPLLEGEIPRAMDFIAGAASRMSSQLEVVLKLFRMGRYEPNPEAVKLGQIFRSVVDTHVHPEDAAQVLVALDAIPELELDREAMHILASNLVSNALKYRHSTRPCRVRVTATLDDAGLTLCVADNGRGIAAEDHEEIFKLFRRCGRQDTPGEGVGLTFCRTLVNRLGGRLWLESESGEGSRFHVRLPVRLPVRPPVRALVSGARPATRRSARGSAAA